VFKSVLLPVDLNDGHSWKKALPLALEMARTHGARLHVMTVVPDFGLPMVAQQFPPGYEARLREQALEGLRALTAAEVPAGVTVDHHVAEGSIYREILAKAKALGADLIVMASHRPELADYLIGPNAARVVRHATCSVLVVRP
jgi:nucleotide-binding universal stress UspA family protein